MNPIVYIVDDDAAVTAALRNLLTADDYTVISFHRLMISWLTLLLPFPVA